MLSETTASVFALVIALWLAATATLKLDDQLEEFDGSMDLLDIYVDTACFYAMSFLIGLLVAISHN